MHKAILSSWSKYFETACQKGFKEANSNTIDLQTSDSDPTCDDPEAVKCMVHFFYHFDYEVEKVDASAYRQPAPKAKAIEYACSYHCGRHGAHYGSCPCSGYYDVLVAAKRSPGTAVPHAADSSDTDGNILMHAKVFAVAIK